jgi:hypothetical protein
VTAPRQLGLAGLLAAGRTPAEARAEIRADLLAEPGALDIIRDMGRDAEGRAALAWSREQWARYGLAPPWDDDPEEPR